MAKITINGKEIEVQDGRNLVDAAEENGTDIPHYCYHAGLSVAGQCRMCLVEVEGNPKLQAACTMRCQNGMKITTNSPKVQDAVKWSLEFHLINHPIDCPICDQAGECGLQNYYMEHGKYKSEMNEQKVLKQKAVDLGDHVMLDKERCILCSRCVRFTAEVSKTGELGIFNRGDRSVIGTIDNKPLSGNYQVNVVDICPVGALTSKDFRFEQRVWFLEESPSVCSGCSKGCNVDVHHKKGKHIYRIKPRYNEKINTWWMCDKGRYTYKDSNYDRRVTTAQLGGVDLSYTEAIQTWVSELRTLIATERTEEIGVWLTPQQTNEELASLFDQLTSLGIKKFYSENIESLIANDKDADGFLLRTDTTVNSRGFAEVAKSKSIKTKSLDDLVQAIERETVSHLIVVAPEGEPFLAPLRRLSNLIKPQQFVVLLTPQKAAAELFPMGLTLPTITHYEKTGTIINHAGISQKISSTFRMFSETRSIQEVLHETVDAHRRPTERIERMAN